MTEAREAARAAAWEAAKALVEEQTNGCVTERIDMAADALLAFAAAREQTLLDEVKPLAEWAMANGCEDDTPWVVFDFVLKRLRARGAAPEGPLVVRAEPIEPDWPKEMRAAPAETGETT